MRISSWSATPGNRNGMLSPPLREFNLVGLRFSLAYEARRSTRWEISDFPPGGRPWLGVFWGWGAWKLVRLRSAFGVGLGMEGGVLGGKERTSRNPADARRDGGTLGFLFRSGGSSDAPGPARASAPRMLPGVRRVKSTARRGFLLCVATL